MCTPQYIEYLPNHVQEKNKDCQTESFTWSNCSSEEVTTKIKQLKN